MSDKSSEVGKVFVKVRHAEKVYYLFSKKKARGSKKKHKHLELLGGAIEEGDKDFTAGTIRELGEEEKTGLLASRLSPQHPSRTIDIDGCIHHIFNISIEFAEYVNLKPKRKESLGFKLIPASSLHKKSFLQSLTKQTRKIFVALAVGE